MSKEAPSKGKRGRKRGARGKLRRSQEIDHVLVEETFTLNRPGHAVAETADDRKAGEGCYVSATVHNRRYYGVLVDQAALKAASLLHFQDEASGLELNRKMEELLQRQQAEQQELGETNGHADNANGDRKRPANNSLESNESKRQRLDAVPDKSGSRPSAASVSHPVQKFRYVGPVKDEALTPAGYRVLLATYADVSAAAEDDSERSKLIDKACRSGGGFVGEYYYQYEAMSSILQISDVAKSRDTSGLRMSMGFQSFLQNTTLPDWFPLSNLQVGQQKVLSMLSMKKDHSGKVVWDATSRPKVDSAVLPPQKEMVPMEPRSSYRICVVGGGIAGLSCCLELFRICEQNDIDIEVVLVEGRSRLGGRLRTDRNTFKASDGETPFPVDLGASWIHGIDLNPLAALAKEAGVDFVTTSEDVKMFQSGMVEVDPEKDEQAGLMFDKLLDLAANDCWQSDGDEQKAKRCQAAVRWYASGLGESFQGQMNRSPVASDPPPHRQSSDVSVDTAIARAILKQQFARFALLSVEERRMLTWNLKNVEYALGANVKDLSMKFWDIDERHAFEGDHVLLRQGYSTVIDYLYGLLKKRGDRFQCILDFPVGKLEYNRKTTTQNYASRNTHHQQFVELSDTCCVWSQDSSRDVKCDFVVSAVPLGVLKASIQREIQQSSQLSFHPPLPFLKRDAIASVGFGLLNKVYLQFPSAFWANDLGPDQTQFGNASGLNSHHYMFLDVGKTLDPDVTSPAILMSLISGSEAVACEKMTEEALVKEVMETLRTIFAAVDVPNPIAYTVTNWGSDQFSRGSYTFLPPGTTDQDFGALQSPVNGNGDSLLLEGSETMRLFMAGEHTTAMHPSMAHGAMMSGVRAAKEVVDAMNVTISSDTSFDRLIPLSMFRHMNPTTELRCSMCNKEGTRVREGNLLAFKKGSRQVLVHNNCAENSPEVEVFEGQWKDVFASVNRSRSIECFMCSRIGASIGCAHPKCERCYHFSCGEDTGWRFDIDGKEYYCDLHRSLDRQDCHRISMQYFRSKNPSFKDIACQLCGGAGNEEKLGELLAYQRYSKTDVADETMVVVHENCARYTSIVDIGEDSMSRFGKEFRNVFTAVDRSQNCSSCGKSGATVRCSDQSCGSHFHVLCAENLDWNFDKLGPKFRCNLHRENSLPAQAESQLNDNEPKPAFHHALFSVGASERTTDKPSNYDVHTAIHPFEMTESESADTSDEDFEKSDQKTKAVIAAEVSSDIPLALFWFNKKPDGMRQTTVRLVRLFRETVSHRWNVDFYASKSGGTTHHRVLTVASSVPDPFDELVEGDVVLSINGHRIGSPALGSLSKVFAFLGQEVEVMVEVQRAGGFDLWH